MNQTPPLPTWLAVPPTPSPGSWISRQLTAELNGLWRRGERVDALTLLTQHPEIRPNRSILLDLVYEELCLRKLADEKLDPDGFCAQFPHYRDSVYDLLGVVGFTAKHERVLEPDAPSPWPRVGQRWMGFELRRELGRGSFARVFLAAELSLGNRLVAIKVSPRGASEAQTLGRLNHPNIVPVHSVQREAGTDLSVVCMPYLGRATLEDVLERIGSPAALPHAARDLLAVVQDPNLPRDAAAAPDPLLETGSYLDGIAFLGAQLAAALGWIHERGICHRDLKPSNVLMTPAGKPMLLDFNLSFDQQLTDQRRMGGTLPYMSPEQLLATALPCEANPAVLDARSDLYSLGIMLYELLTGRHPFGPIPLKLSQADLCQVLLERQRQPLPSIQESNPRLAAAVAQVVGRCLAYNPDDRPRSAGEVAAALQSHLSSWRRRLRRWTAGRKRLVLAVVVVAGLTGTGALVIRDPKPVSDYDLGIQACTEGHWDRAVSLFKTALAVDPTNDKLFLARARAYQRLGDFRAAFEDYRAAARLVPTDGRYEAGSGYCYNQMKWHLRAKDFYSEAIEKGFRSAEVDNNLAFCWMMTPEWMKPGKVKEVFEFLNEATQRNENLQAAYYNRALFYLALADQDPNSFGQMGVSNPRTLIARGQADIQKAIDLGPKTADLYTNAFSLALKLAPYEHFVQMAPFIPMTPDLCFKIIRLAGLAGPPDNLQMARFYLDQALKHGQNPRLLASRVPHFLQEAPVFMGLNDHPVPLRPPLQAARFVDPLPESFP